MIKKHCRSSPGHLPVWRTMTIAWNGTGIIVPHVGTADCARMFRDNKVFPDFPPTLPQTSGAVHEAIFLYLIAPKFEAEEGERCGYRRKKSRDWIPAFIHSPLFIIHQNRYSSVKQSARLYRLYRAVSVLIPLQTWGIVININIWIICSQWLSGNSFPSWSGSRILPGYHPEGFRICGVSGKVLRARPTPFSLVPRWIQGL